MARQKITGSQIVTASTNGVTNSNLSTTAGDLGGAWVSFTPTFNLNNASSQAVDKTGAYTLTGKTCHFWAKMVVNSSSNFTGLSSVTLNLPFTASSNTPLITPMGNVFFRDTPSGVFAFGRLMLNTTTTAIIWAETVNGTYNVASDITGAIPFGWGLSDYLIVSGFYEIA